MNILKKIKAQSVALDRWWDPLAALLLVCALLTAATRLVVTRWTEELYVAQTLAFLGVLLGLAFGQSRFSPRVVFWMAMGYSIVVIPWQLGLTITGDLEWRLRMVILYQRLDSTIHLLVIGRPVEDNILFLTLMSILFWALSVQAGYSLVRYGAPWRVVLPTGLALLVIQSYDPYLVRRAWFLAAYLLFSLLLVSRVHYIQQRHNWRVNRVHLPPDIGFDWIRFSLAVVVILTLFAWTVPAFAQTLPTASQIWQFARRPWVKLQDRMSNAFSSLRSSVGLVNDYYGTRLSLGRGTTLSDNPIFTVANPADRPSGVRYYWQAYTYDNYQDGQWKSTFNQTQDINAEKPFGSEEQIPGRVIQLFAIKPYIAIATLYTPAQPIWVSVPARISQSVASDGTIDVAGLQARPMISAGDTYQVESSIANATVEQLQAAGTDYPEWIKNTYLQLPPDITTRTRQLAQDLANGLTNPYDVTNAITSYLRTYTYSETIDQPPANQDVIDWWLFDYKKGFCQYYATAEVILLRSLGIPARMAVGYAQGIEQVIRHPGVEPSRDTGVNFQVRQSDSHAWPQVYFPKIGWVEFEPTASQNPLTRPTEAGDSQSQLNAEQSGILHGPSPLNERDPGDANAGGNSTGPVPANVVRVALFLSSASAAGLLLFSIYNYRARIMTGIQVLPIKVERRMLRMGLKPPAFLRRWARYSSLSPTQRSYLEINRALSRLGHPPALFQTPYERAGILINLLPASVNSVNSLLDVYHRVTYSQSADDPEAARRAGKEIRKLSYLAALRRLLARFQEPSRKLRY
jgi:transglutaminase-like putative cysteine protease